MYAATITGVLAEGIKFTLRLQTYFGRGANVLVRYGRLPIDFSALFGSWRGALAFQIVKQADDICGEGEMQRALRESKAKALMLGRTFEKHAKGRMVGEK
jgi:hypothetical protein